MDALYLQGKLKSTGTAYLFFLLFGAHYIYFGKIGKQILFWITFGGFGIWALIDLFTLGSQVDMINAPILQQIKQLQQEERAQQFMMMNAMKNQN